MSCSVDGCDRRHHARLRTKRRRPSRHWTDVWREEHACAFTVAQMTQDAMLGEVHQALLRIRDRERRRTAPGCLPSVADALGGEIAVLQALLRDADAGGDR